MLAGYVQCAGSLRRRRQLRRRADQQTTTAALRHAVPGNNASLQRGRVRDAVHLGVRHVRGTCADLSTDKAHCGQCLAVCAGNAICLAGDCSCPAGTNNCAGVCSNPLSDANNCGTCGTQCDPSQVCVMGRCQ